MVGIEQIVASFGKKRKSAVWLPALTLGYLYHLTGNEWYLVGGAVSCCGAMVLYDLAIEILGEGDIRKRKSFGYQDILRVIPSVPAETTNFVLLWFSIVSYPIAAGYGIVSLVLNFNHSNIFLVGLVSAYLGFALTARFNGPAIFSQEEPDEKLQMSDIWPHMPDKYEMKFEDWMKGVVGTKEETDEKYEPLPGYQ